MSYDNLSSVSQNVLKFYQQLTGEERRVPWPFIFDQNNQSSDGICNITLGIFCFIVDDPAYRK
jgi:hypothetical protein